MEPGILPEEMFIFGMFIALGLFSVVAAIGNIEWYFRTEGARMFVRWWGRRGARVFYFLLGIALMAGGLLGLLGRRLQ